MRDLTKKNLGQLSQSLEAAQAAFREVEKLAEQARAEILPYFKKHDLDFMAGNGDWHISRPSDYDPKGREVPVHDDQLPKNILDLLMLEIAHADHLGFYIRDIKRGEW